MRINHVVQRELSRREEIRKEIVVLRMRLDAVKRLIASVKSERVRRR